jgi:exodeoxyribonuclease VII small subunit
MAGGTLRMTKDAEITERLERIDEIIDQLDEAECDRDEGGDLYEEGQRLLAEVRDRLDDGSGDIVDLE